MYGIGYELDTIGAGDYNPTVFKLLFKKITLNGKTYDWTEFEQMMHEQEKTIGDVWLFVNTGEGMDENDYVLHYDIELKDGLFVIKYDETMAIVHVSNVGHFVGVLGVLAQNGMDEFEQAFDNVVSLNDVDGIEDHVGKWKNQGRLPEKFKEKLVLFTS